MEGGFSPRIGTFFILLGLGFLIVFISSAYSGDLRLGYFVLSAAAFGLGAILRRGSRRSESGRFGAINKLREQNRIRKEESRQKEPKKK